MYICLKDMQIIHALEIKWIIKIHILPGQVVQVVGALSCKLKRPGLIPGQGICLDCGLGPGPGRYQRS